VAHHSQVVGDMVSEIVPEVSVDARAGQNRADTHSAEDMERGTAGDDSKEGHVVAVDAQFRCADGAEDDQVPEVVHCARPVTVEAALKVLDVADRSERSTNQPWQVVVVARMVGWVVIVEAAAAPREEHSVALHSLPLPLCHSAFSSGTFGRGRKASE
jgi:hypothetical protein